MDYLADFKFSGDIYAIEEGRVMVNGKVITKASYQVNFGDDITVIPKEEEFVSRAAYKLKAAFDSFHFSIEEEVVLDIGASTGGFTDLCLKKGAKKVYALDVGHLQLAKELDEDPRVVKMEGMNARHLEQSWFMDSIDFICMEYVKGKNCFNSFSKLFLSKAKKRKFADKVTSAMYAWHSKSNEKFGPIQNPIYNDWLEYYKPLAFDVLQAARSMVNERKLEAFFLDVMELAWSNFDYIFSEKVENARLIHGDLNVMNIMADENLNPIAIIDPLESKWADAEFDLFQLKNLTGNAFGLYEMYKSKYPTSKNCDLKVAFYALYHEIYCYISSGRRTKINHLRCLIQLKKEMRKSGL